MIKALIINLFMVLGILSLFQATLTLPGIAGIILTIGMAVDANVLIFERVKEEIRSGSKMINAVENGYKRALLYPFSTALIILDPLLISSLTRSKINTLASTAIPIVKIMPAIPGKVKVA